MPTRNVNVDVHHVTRVEGHGSIVVNVSDGRVEKCEWHVPEAPRFFEAMIRGRHYSEIGRITSRICGICSIGHTLASVKATEAALGMRISKQSDLLRRVLKEAENFDSHILHVCFLAVPDFVGAPSVFPMVETHREAVKCALRLKRLSHEWGSVIGGRTTHPNKVVPGGFASLPSDANTPRRAESELRRLRQMILDAMPDMTAMYEVVKSLMPKIPVCERPTEYVALVEDAGYAVYDGNIGCVLPDGTRETVQVADYKTVAREYVSPWSTAKHAKHRLDSYMAGALARINLNYDHLHPEAKKIAEGLELTAPCFNSYMNTVAQFIECVHYAHSAIGYLDELLDTGITDERPVPPTRFCRGSGATEVPRGILFHEYEYDSDGMCVGGNCVIPTNQNHANIQLDMEKLVPELLEKNASEDEIRLALEMLVRAYDPCISCSTHYMDVEFKRTIEQPRERGRET